jgi:hypothetical protein
VEACDVLPLLWLVSCSLAEWLFLALSLGAYQNPHKNNFRNKSGDEVQLYLKFILCNVSTHICQIYIYILVHR